MSDRDARDSGAAGTAETLQNDRHLRRWKVAAAAISVGALVALTVTSVFRGPNDVWSIAIPVVAAVLVALLVVGLVRGRRPSRRPPR